MTVRLETVSIAAGVVRGLNQWAPRVAAMLPKVSAANAAMFAELKTLCDRAGAVTPESTYGELVAIHDDFVKFVAWNGELAMKKFDALKRIQKCLQCQAPFKVTKSRKIFCSAPCVDVWRAEHPHPDLYKRNTNQ